MTEPTPIDLLGLNCLDVRATVEAMLRCVTKAQANIDHYRQTRERASIDRFADCLNQVQKDAVTVTDSVAQTRKTLAALTSS